MPKSKALSTHVNPEVHKFQCVICPYIGKNQTDWFDHCNNHTRDPVEAKAARKGAAKPTPKKPIATKQTARAKPIATPKKRGQK